MPPRPILDFLVRFFVAELNWMSQLIHAPSFLSHYQSWWNRRPGPGSDPAVVDFVVADIDFAATVLFMCAMATQFLPSPGLPVDQIRGVPLSRIKEDCLDVGEDLGAAAAKIDPAGSLFRSQHICFAGLIEVGEGRMASAYEALERAARLFRSANYHGERTAETGDLMNQVEAEMRRRVFCNIYIWDG